MKRPDPRRTLWLSLLCAVCLCVLPSSSVANSTKLFYEGQKALDKGEYKRAIKLLKKAAKELSHWGIIHLELARALLLSGAHPIQIESTLQKALKFLPQNPRVHEIAGKYWEQREDIDKALAHYEIAIKMGLPSAHPCLRAAEIWLSRNKASKALPCLLLLERRQQEKAKTQGFLAQVYTAQGKFHMAMNYWAIALPKHMRSVDFIQKALLFYSANLAQRPYKQKREWKKRIKMLRERLKLLLSQDTPGSNTTLYPPLDAKFRALHWFLKQSMLWPPYDWIAGLEFLISARKASAKGQTKRASARLELALKEIPRWELVYMEIARGLWRAAASAEEILKPLKKAISLHPKNPHVQELAGLFWEGQGNPQQALKHYKKALKGKLNSPIPCLHAARMWMQAGKGERGLSCLKSLYYAKQQLPTVTLLLARISQQKALLEEAGKYWQRVSTFYKNSVGLHKEALAFFTRYLASQPPKLRQQWKRNIQNLTKQIERLEPKQPDRRLRPLLPSRR